MNSQITYDAIYNAAKENNKAALSIVLKESPIGVVQKIQIEKRGRVINITLSPISQLAMEGNDKAVELLLEQGASKGEAVKGYAIGGHFKQVTDLLEQGASKNKAILGFAIGGYTKLVDELVRLDDLIEQDDWERIDIANIALGYATGGHVDLVEELLKKKTYNYNYIIDDIIFGYAIGGHTEQLNAFVIKRGIEIDIDDNVRGYATGGHIKQVNELLEQGANISEAIAGYRAGGYTEHADALSKQKILFKKINELRAYGTKLKDQGQQRKGENAIQLANNINKEVVEFLFTKVNEHDTTSQNLSKLITKGYSSMGENRKLKDIIGHIVLALTGIGLVIILGKKLLSESKSGFLNKTKRQKVLKEIDKEVKKMVKKP